MFSRDQLDGEWLWSFIWRLQGHHQFTLKRVRTRWLRLISPCPTLLSMNISPEDNARGTQKRILKDGKMKVNWFGTLDWRNNITVCCFMSLHLIEEGDPNWAFPYLVFNLATEGIQVGSSPLACMEVPATVSGKHPYTAIPWARGINGVLPTISGKALSFPIAPEIALLLWDILNQPDGTDKRDSLVWETSSLM